MPGDPRMRAPDADRERTATLLREHHAQGRLTPEEFDVIKMHPLWGIELLGSIEFPWPIAPIVRSHHEKLDGSGYPDGLRGTDVPLHAQIVCIADVFDAMTSARSYQSPVSAGDALTRMRGLTHWWYPDVFDAFATAVASAAPLMDC